VPLPPGPSLRCGVPALPHGDGFSHARAFALQLALAVVPLVITGAGLAVALGAESFAEVVPRTIVAISPRSRDEAGAGVALRVVEQGS
jgi:hypothetical protein